MPTATATYRDGRTITWKDGEVSGHYRLLLDFAIAARNAGTVNVTPEGPAVAAADYKREPLAFVALAQVAVPADPEPQWQVSADFKGPTPPPAPEPVPAA